MSGLTPGAALAWQIAALEADGAGHERIERAHLLIGILSLEKFREKAAHELSLPPDLLAAIRQEIDSLGDVLRRASVNGADLRRQTRVAVGTGDAPRGRGSVSRSDACRRVFATAGAMANGRAASALDLLAAVAMDPDAAMNAALARCGASAASLAAAVAAPAPVSPLLPRPPERAAAAPSLPKGSETPELDRVSRDLTALAADGALGPIIGRRDVLLELVRTLARSSKNNPLLVGDAGVGKTAIVEGLAIRAAAGKDAAVLGGKRIVELNVGALLAGTEYRGQFEERVTAILAEVAAHPEIIVFIDELHAIVGAGRIGKGGLDAANLLKPALARGDFRCIGATTLDECRQYIETDSALERRFARIDVAEPSRDETVEILSGLRPKWEHHHGVSIEPAALEAAVDLSIRFDVDHRLPDKAADLVDKASARARVPMLSVQWPPPPDATPGSAGGTVPVDARLIAEVLAEKCGLPLELVLSGDDAGKRLLELEGFLRERLIGQEEAIARVSRRLRLAHAGLAERRGPLGVFLFLGPTGVGKTELARLLAEFLFGRRSDVTRLDMSELMEEHSVAKLIGAPPGYVGHDEEGQLTGALRARPYSVVLFDEAEKAHPRVFDLFLQLFDEGRLTDSKGRSADGRHAIFIMTSNLGTGLAPEAVVGFAPGGGVASAEEAIALDAARRFFRPELLNRVDEVVVFRPLDKEAVLRIVRPLLAGLADSVRRQHGATLEISPEAVAFLAEAGYSAAHGARELSRTVERLVQAPLSGLVLSGKLSRHPVWRVVYDEGGVYLLPAEPAGTR